MTTSMPDPAPWAPDNPPSQPTLTVPEPEPRVGEGSPWAPADGENRDHILDWWRAWWRRVFFPWLAAFVQWILDILQDLADYLNSWIHSVDVYITQHATSGHNIWLTRTPINHTGTTDVIIPESGVSNGVQVPHVDDLVLDSTTSRTLAVITAVTDDTHVTVSPDGVIGGNTLWTTGTPINTTGTTDVTLTPIGTRYPQLGDWVSDASDNLRIGIITNITDATHVDVTPYSTMRGMVGLGWWITPVTLNTTGATDVTITGTDQHPPQLNDLVIDTTVDATWGTITAITDNTHVTVTAVGSLRGPAGIADSQTITITTPQLAAQAAWTGHVTDFPQMDGAFQLTVSSRAWVRVYASQAYMQADATRDYMTPINIQNDHGCYLDFYGTPDELSKTLTPGIMISDIGDGIWVSIVNTSGQPAIITAIFQTRIFRS